MSKTIFILLTMVASSILGRDLNSQEVLYFETLVDAQQSANEGLSTVFVAFPPVDSNTGFLVTRSGEVRILDVATKQILSEPFLTVDDLAGGGQGGLYCLAFHPNYELNGRLFVCYTAGDGDFVVQEYLRKSVGRAIPGQRVFTIEHVTDSPIDNGDGLGLVLMASSTFR